MCQLLEAEGRRDAGASQGAASADHGRSSGLGDLGPKASAGHAYTLGGRTGRRLTIRIAVLVSGSGSNLQALIDRLDPATAEICLVLSDKEQALGLERARSAGIPTKVVNWSGDRQAFTADICDAVETSGAELMVLAGFMRILGPEAITRFPNRILNIHPSLLPSFPGAHAVEDAIEYGVKTTGVTIHFVDEEVDHGPIVMQEAVPVNDDDTADSLHARIQEVEHRLYPAVVEALCQGRLHVEGRKVIWR